MQYVTILINLYGNEQRSTSNDKYFSFQIQQQTFTILMHIYKILTPEISNDHLL